MKLNKKEIENLACLCFNFTCEDVCLLFKKAVYYKSTSKHQLKFDSEALIEAFKALKDLKSVFKSDL